MDQLHHVLAAAIVVLLVVGAVGWLLFVIKQDRCRILEDTIIILESEYQERLLSERLGLIAEFFGLNIDLSGHLRSLVRHYRQGDREYFERIGEDAPEEVRQAFEYWWKSWYENNKAEPIPKVFLN